MYLDLTADTDFFQIGDHSQSKPILVEGLDGNLVNPSYRKRQRRLALAEFYRRENARLRKPCPTCTTLVQPHLLEQHYEAYHPSIKMIPHTN